MKIYIDHMSLGDFPCYEIEQDYPVKVLVESHWEQVDTSNKRRVIIPMEHEYWSLNPNDDLPLPPIPKDTLVSINEPEPQMLILYGHPNVVQGYDKQWYYNFLYGAALFPADLVLDFACFETSKQAVGAVCRGLPKNV